MSIFINDVKYAFRQLRKSPGFTVVVVLILALGIGANVTIFSFINDYLLRPLPFADHERLVFFMDVDTVTRERLSLDYGDYLNWQERNQTFEQLACHRFQDITLTGIPDPVRLSGMQISDNLLPMLGVKPEVGRLFNAEDCRPGSMGTVLVSHRLWQNRFGGRSDVIGESIILDDEPYTVIGVMPSAFVYPPLYEEPVDLWTPIGRMANSYAFKNRGYHPDIEGIGKLKEGVSLAQAKADMNAISQQMACEFPNSFHGGVSVEYFHDILVEDIEPILLLLMVAVAFVLLLVCVNLTNLLLTRSIARTKEFAVRCALGARSWRLVRQVVSENMILMGIGGTLGFVFAFWGAEALRIVFAHRMPALDNGALRGGGIILWFTIAVTCISCLLVSLVPVLGSIRTNVSRIIRDTTHTATASGWSQRVRNALVIAQITLAMVLLIGSGLLLRSYMIYLHSNPGYEPDGVVTLSIHPPTKSYRNYSKRKCLVQDLLEQVRALPGVKHAGVTANLGGSGNAYCVEGHPPYTDGMAPVSESLFVTPDYFSTMGIELLEGSYTAEAEHGDSQQLVLVDETFARMWWPLESPIGKRFQLGQRIDANNTWYHIIGMVPRVSYWGVDQDMRETIYFCGPHIAPQNFILVVRTRNDPLAFVAPIRQIIARIDTAIPTPEVQTLHARMAEQSFLRRTTTGVFGLFSLTALLLTTLGIYSVMAYWVAQRTGEIGIRMALGAQSKDILRKVLIQSSRLLGLGLLFGLAGGLVFSQVLSSRLFGVTALDPGTYLGVIALLISVTLLACLIPARRAAKIDPMEALRYE